MLLTAALASIALALATAVWFGPTAFTRFFADKGETGYPPWLFYQGNNQSLLAVLLRTWGVTDLSQADGVLLGYGTLAVAILTVTTLAAIRSRSEHGAWGLASIVCMTLLLNPATLDHYAVLLVAPLLLVWSERHSMPGGWLGAAGLITISYLLAQIPGAAWVFWSITMVWLVITVRGLRGPRATRRAEPAPPDATASAPQRPT